MFRRLWFGPMPVLESNVRNKHQGEGAAEGKGNPVRPQMYSLQSKMQGLVMSTNAALGDALINS